MTSLTKVNARDRILAAAADVAREIGPGSLSLDAIAHRAGVSKGGLLYHFPTKAALMAAMIETHLAEFEQTLAASTKEGIGALATYVRASAAENGAIRGSKAWIFSAMAEDPHFLDPIRRAKRRMFERLMAETGDRTAALVVFLAVEGLKSLTIFDFETLSADEQAQAIEALVTMAAATAAPCDGRVTDTA